MEIEHIKLISNTQKEPIEMLESAAGFPPFTRSNWAEGHLLKLPLLFKPSEVVCNYHFSSSQKEIHYKELAHLFKNLHNDLFSKVIKKPLVIWEVGEVVSFSDIALIRALRSVWSIYCNRKETPLIPLEILAKTELGYHSSLLKILSAEVEGIISKQLSESDLKDYISEFKLLKTIDPFAGSKYIESQTLQYTQQILNLLVPNK